MTGLQVTPILPRFGAEVRGLDFSRPISDETMREVRAIQDQWGVTVWRGTGLDDDGQVAFAARFGELEFAPARAATADIQRRCRPELFSSTNLGADNTINRDAAASAYRKGDGLWHSDSSFMQTRSSYCLLRAAEVPDKDGLTWFADSRSAYEDLPQAMKDKLEGLVAEHSLWWSRKLGGAEITEDEIDARTRSHHPMVYVEAATGRKSLFVGAHCRDVVGMDRAEGRALIAELNAWIVQPRYVFSVAWQVGDMAIWNNLTTQHRGGEFDAVNQRRDMRRATVRDADSVPPPAGHYSALFAEMPTMIKDAGTRKPAEPVPA